MPKASQRPSWGRSVWGLVPVLCLGFAFFLALRYPSLIDRDPSKTTGVAHSFSLILYAYAQDHGNKYPEGRSSTEVFQKLIDEGFINDPTYFYFPTAGKVKPIRGEKLKPENVCWDYTAGLDVSNARDMPLVFVTGYRLDYSPGGSATPLARPSMFQTIFSTDPIALELRRGITVGYGDMHAIFLPIDRTKGAALNVMPSDFPANGKTLVQLTPNGPLK